MLRRGLLALAVVFALLDATARGQLLLLGVGGGPAGGAPSGLLTNLIYSFPLNEASGPAIDETGTISNLTDNNAVGAGSGTRDFNGTNQYLSHADEANLRCGDVTCTWEVWFTADAPTGVMLGKDSDTPADSRDLTFDLNALDARFYVNGGGGGLLVQWGATLSTATEYQAVFGHNAISEQLWLAINDGTPATATTGGTAPQASTAEFRIGARVFSGAEGFFNGQMRLVRFWKNRDLRDTAGAITCLYNGGSGRAYPFTGCS